MPTPRVGPNVSREYTIFELDVDESAVRSVLALLPGVRPLPTDRGASPETDDSSDDRSPDDDSPAADDVPSSVMIGRARRATDAGATATDDGRPSTWAGRRISTPWPGAPMDEGEDDEDEGMLHRLGGRKVLIAVGLVLGLGVVGVAVFWWRSRRGSADDVVATDEGRGTDLEPGYPGDQASEAGPAESAAGSPADESESRSYPMDVAPVVGMAFLAAVTVLLRRFRRRE